MPSPIILNLFSLQYGNNTTSSMFGLHNHASKGEYIELHTSKSGLSIMIAIEIKTISFHFSFSLMQIIAIFKHLWGKILQEMSYG